MIAEPTRRHILDLLRERPRTVTELVGSLDLSQPGVSKHLRVLREAGLPVSLTENLDAMHAVRHIPLEDREAVKYARKPRIHTFVATSDIHLKHKLRMDRDAALAEAVEGPAAAHVRRGATSQDILDTAAAIVTRDAKVLVVEELDGVHFDIDERIRFCDARLAPEGSAAAPYYIPPSEDLSRPGTTWLPTLGETSFSWWRLATIWYHEAVPGHHLQISATVINREHLSRFQRAMAWNSGWGEGWALYAERLMDELGAFDEPGLEMGYLMSQALRKLTAIVSKSKTCLVFINQIREKIGVMFGNPETTTGGRALKFYSSVRLDIRRIAAIKDGDRVVGNRTRVKVVKNKMAAPFREAEFDILYGEGISREGDLIDMAVGLNLIEKSGSWYSFGGERIGQGRKNPRHFLCENADITKKIEAQARKALNLPSPEEEAKPAEAGSTRGKKPSQE